MLASRFSGRWDEGLEKDPEGRFFIDQPFSLFSPFLTYLRSMSNEHPLGPKLLPPRFDIRVDRHDFMRMVEYYGCTRAVYRTEIVILCGEETEIQISPFPEATAKAEIWSTFWLILAEGHERKIVAFEIQVEKIDHFVVGWSRWVTNTQYERDAWTKAGRDGYHIDLDCSANKIYGQGQSISLKAPIEVRHGSVIRCEAVGPKWFVDGVEIEPLINSEASSMPTVNLSQPGVCPAFAGKGGMRVVNVELTKET
jgi:hypothetical protein